MMMFTINHVGGGSGSCIGCESRYKCIYFLFGSGPQVKLYEIFASISKRRSVCVYVYVCTCVHVL